MLDLQTATTPATPPRVITQEDFRSTWEPQGWKLLILGPTATWRQEWGVWEAIREIVQNAMDETEAYQWGRDSEGLWISDNGRGIGVSDFLLGPPTLKAPHARGKYGEGMKIGALVLLREGYSVRIDTVGKEVWIIFVQTGVNSGTVEQLAALWRPSGKIQGTVFHIIGYDGEDYADRFAVNLPRKDILHEGKSLLWAPILRNNQIIDWGGEDWQPGMYGRIYARDIYMRDIESPFAYNLWSFEMAPDRHAPKQEDDLWRDVGRTWATVRNVHLLSRFLSMVSEPPQLKTAESQHILLDNLGNIRPDFTYLQTMGENREFWQMAFNQTFGEDAVLVKSWDHKLERLVEHLGYKPIRVKWAVESYLADVVKDGSALVRQSQQKLSEAETIPDEKLKPLELAMLNLARAIAKDLYRSSPVAGVYAAIIPPASDRVRTSGMYGHTTKLIFISMDQFTNVVKLVDTLIHELAHHHSEAEDLTEAHAEAMSLIAARVVRNTYEGKYDETMKDVVQPHPEWA